MRKTLILTYGVAVYVGFLGVFVYLLAFMLNLVPGSLDAARTGAFWPALAIDTLLIGLFALQHSGMARPAFKDWLTRFIPRSIERSTYCLASNVALVVLMLNWRPLGIEVWTITNPIARAAMFTSFAVGILTVLGSTYLIDHFDLFGLRQVWLAFRGRPYQPLKFATPGPYRLVRPLRGLDDHALVHAHHACRPPAVCRRLDTLHAGGDSLGRERSGRAPGPGVRRLSPPRADAGAAVVPPSGLMIAMPSGVLPNKPWASPMTLDG